MGAVTTYVTVTATGDVPMADLVFVLALVMFTVATVINWRAGTRLKRLEEEFTQTDEDLEDQLWKHRNMTK